jgi:probable HAF family extracellular repeat protein
MRDLGTLGGISSWAYGINASGQVVGSSYLSNNSDQHAFLYDGTTMRDLGTLGGISSWAYGINASGQVVGWSYITPGSPYRRAFLHDGITMRNLGTLDGGYDSWAEGINASGQVVGGSYSITGYSRAFLYDGTVMRDLGTLGGSGSRAYGINARGHVVGISGLSGDAAAHAFLYDGAMRDLETLPEVVAARWQTLYANSNTLAINDSGQIVGTGRTRVGYNRAFRLHPQTMSRYMTTVNPANLYNLGCAQTHQNGVVILAFGRPRFNGTDYGTSLFQANGFTPISSIEAAVKAFLDGYYNCAGRGVMVVAVGTSNDGNDTTYAHGRAWGEMVARLNNYITFPPSYQNRLTVVGASDIEIGFNTPANSRAWVDGYASSSPVNYYNYGDAQECPTSGAGPCGNGWTQEDVWYVSWGSPANPLPVPEIYRTDGAQARQWTALAAYGRSVHGVDPFIPAALTQWQACRDPGRRCNASIRNTPAGAWYQLMNGLYGIAPDPTTAQNILYSSDITWQN